MNRNLVLLLLFVFVKGFSQEISPQTQVVDFQRIEAKLKLDFDTQTILGKLEVRFKMLKDAPNVALDAKKMTIEDRTSQFEIIATETQVIFKGDFIAGQEYTAVFDYQAQPKQTLYFVNNQGAPQIWTQGQGKFTSHWLPSLDDMNDKIEFDIKFRDKAGKTFIANGRYNEQSLDYGVVDYTFDMQEPISSYLVAFVVGDYAVKKETSISGVPLEYYYYPQDSLKVEPTYRYSKQIFDFLEKEIGVPFPWQVYRQVPVKDFLYAGMENASCTIFSDSFMVDEIGFVDRNYVNVNAHELAHQWFGDLVTETKSDHHWLHEGFATYYALLAEREIFGDDYFYYKLFESAEQLRELSDQGKGQKLVAAGGSSLTYYQKGAWAVHILREKVGEEAFTKAVKGYLVKHAFKNVTTDDFMHAVQAQTTVDLEQFKKDWLYQAAFQSQDALDALKKSDFIKQYFQLQALRPVPFLQKAGALRDAIGTGNDYLGQEAVYQLAGEPITGQVKQLYTAVILGDNVLMKQAVSQSISNTDTFGLEALQALSQEPSYTTKETVLLQRWTGLRERKKANEMRNLLNEMEEEFGFSDGTIRTLWLTLSLATPDYRPETGRARYQELISYTDPSLPFQLRENAFRYLFQIQSFEEQSLKNLIEGCVHHVWRFRESARSIFKEVVKNPENKKLIEQLTTTLPKNQKGYLSRTL